VNRYELAALGRAAVSLSIGAAALYVAGRLIGWPLVAGILVLAVGDAIWIATSTRWRLW
jgi:hypothetical protein